MRHLTEEQFDAEFTLMHDHPLQTVDEIEKELGKSIDASHIWTSVDGDEGGTYMLAGVHWVNAWGFNVTEQPHDFDIEVELESAEDESQRYQEEKLTSAYRMQITGLDAIYDTESYIDAFIALMADIETNNESRIKEIQAKHPEFELRIDLVIGGDLRS
jgi:hypothetical protein